MTWEHTGSDLTKQDPTTEVEMRLVRTARQRWCGYHSATDKQFANYLGVTMLSKLGWKPGFLHLRKSAVDKIMKLNSPHWYALLKVEEAKK